MIYVANWKMFSNVTQAKYDIQNFIKNNFNIQWHYIRIINVLNVKNHIMVEKEIVCYLINSHNFLVI